MTLMRICSFLPSATEIVCALGLEEELVGVSHECDYPPEVRSRPAVVRTLIETEGRTQRQIDEDVRRVMRDRGALYVAEEPLLRELRPNLLLTQDLCRVCAPSGGDTAAVAERLVTRPDVLSLNPQSVEGILDSIDQVGEATGRSEKAAEVVGALRARVEAVRNRVPRTGPRAIVMEWLDPPFACGHWVPEMVEIAGGTELLGSKGVESRRSSWEEVASARPDILVLSPCGLHLPKVLELTASVLERKELSARVVAVDADSYFARPGPRVVDGIELLAHLFHPNTSPWNGADDAFKWLTR